MVEWLEPTQPCKETLYISYNLQLLIILLDLQFNVRIPKYCRLDTLIG